MVTSHLGRPTEGELKPEDSLQPVVDYLNNGIRCSSTLSAKLFRWH